MSATNGQIAIIAISVEGSGSKATGITKKSQVPAIFGINLPNRALLSSFWRTILFALRKNLAPLPFEGLPMPVICRIENL